MVASDVRKSAVEILAKQHGNGKLLEVSSEDVLKMRIKELWMSNPLTGEFDIHNQCDCDDSTCEFTDEFDFMDIICGKKGYSILLICL